VPVAELPQAWREKLSGAHVTVRVEAADSAPWLRQQPSSPTPPLFGMWRDREDTTDVAGYVRRIRALQFNADGWRNEP
jgi:hypothetical protein